MTVRVKNWSKFQHFKDRRPPWIKLYRDLLDDREWHKLDGDSAKILVSLWLIGSEDSGVIPSSEDLAFRLRISEKHIEKCLGQLGHWLISERYQYDINQSQKISATDIEVPLRDREETETETETEKKATGVATPDGVSDSLWQDFKKLRTAKKSPITQTAISGISREAAKAGLSLPTVLEMCCERGWVGFKAEWTQEKRPAFLPPQPNETVPSKTGIDPTLAKLNAEKAFVKPPSAEMRAKLAALKEGRLQ
jgi:hypothetical protein